MGGWADGWRTPPQGLGGQERRDAVADERMECGTTGSPRHQHTERWRTERARERERAEVRGEKERKKERERESSLT